MSNLEKHFIQQSLYPDVDSEQFLAYLVLNKRYPKLTYQSFDGYHCHALADYTRDIVWIRSEIIRWSTREVIYPATDFCETSTFDICRIWMDLCGETEESKREWVSDISL